MTLLICPFCDSGIAWNNCACKYAAIAQRGGLIRARQLFFTDGSPKQTTKPVPEPAAADDPRTPDPEATVPTRERQGAKSDDGKGLRGEAKAGASGGAGNRRTTNRTARKRAPRGGATDVGPADRANGTGPSRKTSSVRQTKPKNGVTSPGEQRAPSRKKGITVVGSSRRGSVTVASPASRRARKPPQPPTPEPMGADPIRPLDTGGVGGGAVDGPKERRSLLAPKGQCGFCDLRREADAARIHRHRGKPKPT